MSKENVTDNTKFNKKFSDMTDTEIMEAAKTIRKGHYLDTPKTIFDKYKRNIIKITFFKILKILQIRKKHDL